MEGSTEGRYAYPSALARLVASRWTVRPTPAAPELLERLFSTCYQVSLLREEQRPITFRLALGDPALFTASSGPPDGLHRVVFTDPRPLDVHELRRIAPAAPFHRAMIGAGVDPDGALTVWGLLHSGPRWLQSVRGGRDVAQSIPPVLMLAVTGPGRLLVSEGTRTIAELSAGTLSSAAVDVFHAPWLLPGARRRLDAERCQVGSTETPWAELDPALGPRIALHALRRIIATIRGAQHGGTLILLPAGDADAVLRDGRYVTLKYAFRDEEPRRRILTLCLRIMDTFGRLSDRGTPPGRTVGWSEYQASDDQALTRLDEALFEAAHMVAALADVDGAVIMTDELELLGFGGEISGALPDLSAVARALDLEGARRATERTDRVGTRHRSVYRLCQALRDAVGVVISQDGGVRFVRWQDEGVTYWTQVATGPWEV